MPNQVALEFKSVAAKSDIGGQAHHLDLRVRHVTPAQALEHRVGLVALEPQVEQQDGGGHGDQPQPRGHHEQHVEVPLLRVLAGRHEVIRDGDDGACGQGGSGKRVRRFGERLKQTLAMPRVALLPSEMNFRKDGG